MVAETYIRLIPRSLRHFRARVLNYSRIPAESGVTLQDMAYDEIGKQYEAYLESNVSAALCLDLEH